MVCSQCGAEWMNDKAAEKVESMVTNARHDKNTTPHNNILLYSDISSYKTQAHHAVAKEPAAKYGKRRK